MPHLVTLHNKYQDKAFTVLGVNAWDEDKADVSRFAHQMNVPYPLLLNGSSAAKDWGIHSLPTNFLIDKEGKVVGQYSDVNNDNLPKLEARIDKMLN